MTWKHILVALACTCVSKPLVTEGRLNSNGECVCVCVCWGAHLPNVDCLLLVSVRCVENLQSGDECAVTAVIHVLQYAGCVPKPIPSFACIGRCASYLQVSAAYHFLFVGFWVLMGRGGGGQIVKPTNIY